MALTVGELNAILNCDSSPYMKGLQDAGRAAQRWESQTIAASRAVSGVVVAGMAAVGAAMVGAAAYGLKLAADMQTTATSFKVLLGSGEAATAMMKDLKTFAAETPFEFPEIAKAAKSLLAFGVPAEDMKKNLTMIGDIASGLNIPFGELADIYGKIRVQGRVFAEDINQLQGRGIPVVQELAKQYGVTGEEIRAMVEKGKIGFPEIEKAFQSLTGEGGKFQGMMAEQSKTINGLVSTLKDNLGQALTYVGEQLITTFDLPNKLAGAIAFLDQFNAAVAQVGTVQALTNLMPPGLDVAIVAVAGALTTAMIPAWIASATAAWGAATAFAAAMVPLLPFIAIGAAVAATAYLIWKNWQPLKEFFVNFADTISTYVITKWTESKNQTIAIFNSIVDFFKEWWPLLLAACGPIGMMVGFIIGHWDKIKEGTITAWNAVSSFFTEWWGKLVSWVQSWDIWTYAKEAWEALKTNVIDVLKQLANDAWEWGKNLVQGFVDGITSRVGAVWDAAVNMAKAANEAVRKTLDSHSPSKVMMAIGKDICDGLAVGIKENTPVVVDAMKKLSDDLTAAYDVGDIKAYAGLLNTDQSQMAQDLKGRQSLIDTYYDIWQESHRSAMSYMAEGLNGLYGGLTEMFSGIISGTKSVKSAFADMGKKVLQIIADIVAKWAASKIMDSIFGGFNFGGMFGGGGSSSGGGVSFDTVSPYLDLPSFAGGGTAKGWSLVGEKGPELVNFSSPGRVYPADETQEMLSSRNQPVSVQVHVHGVRDTNSFMQSKGQVAAATARAINRAIGRNG